MSTDSEKVALIIGAGTVENSWQPIINALKPDYNFEFDSDSANSFLALTVYQLRFLALSKDPSAKERLIVVLRDFNQTKLEISKQLALFQRERKMSPRKEYFSILDKYIFQKNIEFVQITTNWDTVIDDAANYYGHGNEPANSRIQTFHLHGIYTSPSEMYLPSEIANEPYRSEQHDLSMMKNHTAVVRAVEQCSRVILYGISLDPLDAELTHTLALGWNSPNLRELIIINPDHKKVANRAKLLLDDYKFKIDIFAYVPENLATKIQY
jgi:hypothetical protein